MKIKEKSKNIKENLLTLVETIKTDFRNAKGNSKIL